MRAAHVCRGRRIAPAHEAPRNESNNKPHEPTSGRSTHYGSGRLIRVFRDIGHIFSSLYRHWRFCCLVALPLVWDLLVCAKDLFVAAMVWVLGRACSSRMRCRGIAATPAALRAMGVRGRLARQSWEANSRTNVFPVLASWLLGSREIRLPAKAKACDVCANAAVRISTLHRRCLHDVI